MKVEDAKHFKFFMKEGDGSTLSSFTEVIIDRESIVKIVKLYQEKWAKKMDGIDLEQRNVEEQLELHLPKSEIIKEAYNNIYNNSINAISIGNKIIMNVKNTSKSVDYEIMKLFK